MDLEQKLLCKMPYKNREDRLAASRRFYKNHADEMIQAAKEWQHNNPEKRRIKANRHNAKLRVETVEAYGRACVCCGESEIMFMAIDHIDGSGAEHRKTISQSKFYTWLKMNSFTKDNFQLLCHNCNKAKGSYGQCAHKQSPLFSTPQTRSHNRLKLKIVAAYGGSCICCHENNPYFLAVDHISNDGKKHREITGSGNSFYYWLQRNNFPQEGLQLLCHNCNTAKANYGACPHQKVNNVIA